MAKLGISNKRLLIDKANTTVTIVIALASFITVSSLMATKTLAAKRSYQARVVDAKQDAKNQLEKNKESVEELREAYTAFVEQPTNAIGGLTTGTGERDGDNAKIVLDALPSKYDFPALTSSIEKLLSSRSFKIQTITGNDDEIAQKDNSSLKPEPVEMPVDFTIGGSYVSFVDLLKVLEKTIRPVHVTRLVINASETDMTMEISAKSYYLPGKVLSIETESVQ